MLPRVAFALYLALLPSSAAQLCLPKAETTPPAKPPVRDVIFKNAPLLLDDKRLEIASTVRDDTAFDPAEGRNISNLASVGAERVRAVYQDQGYLEAQVTGRAVPVGTGAATLYDIVIQVEETGPIDHFGEVKIVHATVFPEAGLRDLFAIRRGEIFSREKVAKGLEELQRLYDSAGYINMTTVPTYDFDDEHELMDLQIDVDEGKQFHLRNLEVVGVDPETQARILSGLAIHPGDVFAPATMELAFKNSSLPVQGDDPNEVSKLVDTREGWVDLVIDFRPKLVCPPPDTPCEVDGTLQSCSARF